MSFVLKSTSGSCATLMKTESFKTLTRMLLLGQHLLKQQLTRASMLAIGRSRRLCKPASCFSSSDSVRQSQTVLHEKILVCAAHLQQEAPMERSHDKWIVSLSNPHIQVWPLTFSGLHLILTAPWKASGGNFVEQMGGLEGVLLGPLGGVPEGFRPPLEDM